MPLIGDFHYNGHKLLTQFPDCAQALSKYRINPGNVGRGTRGEDNFAQMIEVACRYERPVRIGVNWGSLDQELLARLMDENSARPEPWDAAAVLREALFTEYLVATRVIISRTHPTAALRDDSQCRQCRLLAHFSDIRRCPI